MKLSFLLKREAVLQPQSLQHNTFIITLAAIVTQVQDQLQHYAATCWTLGNIIFNLKGQSTQTTFTGLFIEF